VQSGIATDPGADQRGYSTLTPWKARELLRIRRAEVEDEHGSLPADSSTWNDFAVRESGVRGSCKGVGMASAQSLSESDRRLVAAWAADCAERVLFLFESEAPDDDRPRDGIARARAFAAGTLDVSGEIRRRFVAGRASHAVTSPAAKAAAWAAGQAAGVAHMGAHALGAAAYAAKARQLSEPDDVAAAAEEIRWQIAQMSDQVRAALRSLPLLGQDDSGPLGSGLLASGALGAHIRVIQGALHESLP